MSKFLLNLLQISKALVNSKIQFLIQKFFFLTFSPIDLAAHSAFGLASPLASLPSVHGGPRAAGRFTTRGPGPRFYPLENNSLNQYFQEFCKEAHVFL
jgi:hypothetical protein